MEAQAFLPPAQNAVHTALNLLKLKTFPHPYPALTCMTSLYAVYQPSSTPSGVTYATLLCRHSMMCKVSSVLSVTQTILTLFHNTKYDLKVRI